MTIGYPRRQCAGGDLDDRDPGAPQRRQVQPHQLPVRQETGQRFKVGRVTPDRHLKILAGCMMF